MTNERRAITRQAHSLLRPTFRKRRDLLPDLAQSSAEALAEYVRRQVGVHTRPGIVVSIATAGDLLQFNPHAHILVSDGGSSTDGSFRALESWDGEALMRLVRERLLARLVQRHAISEELVRKLLAWKHPGFTAFVGRPIPPEDTRVIEDMAGYIVRNPVSLKRLVYIDGHEAVIYRALKPNPSLGQNFIALDPLEWLARIPAGIAPSPTATTPSESGASAPRNRKEITETVRASRQGDRVPQAGRA